MKRATSTLALVLIALAPAFAEGDAEAGLKVFNRCKACHVPDQVQNRVGPHLVGIVGRPAASVADFNYSDAMRAKGEEGLVWTEENLANYLTAPRAVVPGGTMAFAGLKKPDDIANVIAYLKSLPTP